MQSLQISIPSVWIEIKIFHQANASQQTRPRALRDHCDTWVYLFGAVCPERSIGAAVVLPHVNVDGMSVHLAEISRSVTKLPITR